MKVLLGATAHYRECVLILLTTMLLGCSYGPSKPPTVRVAGVITIGGKPVEGIEVHFESETFSSFGKTDAEGKYRLVQGATVGENRVYLSKMTGGPPGATQQEGIDDYQLQLMAEASGGKASSNIPVQTIPAEYSDKNKSKLTYTVPSGGTGDANFDL
jgi:hypothetical protein